MIVVDTNVICYLLLPVTQSAKARALFRRDSEWVAPLLWRSEFRNVLATYVRQRLLSVADALDFAEEAETLMNGREFIVRSADVLQLASQTGQSAYDCEYVALARDLKLRLVTSDRKLVKAFPQVAVHLDTFI